MNIYFSDCFLQSVKDLPEDVKRTLKKKLDIIADNPSHPSLRTKKIKGREHLFEATITKEEIIEAIHESRDRAEK